MKYRHSVNLEFIDWLTKNATMFNLSAIENTCLIPAGLLSKHIKDKQMLSELHVAALRRYFNDLLKTPMNIYRRNLYLQDE